MKCEDVNKDDFWGIADLVPQKRTRPLATPGFSSTQPVEIRVEPVRGQGDEQGFGDQVLSVRYVNPPEGKAAEPEEEYAPQNSLISAVRIYRQKRDYPYYEQFCRQAAELDALEGEACEAVPFFSYMPQYTQLNAAQRAYYLWWRTSFRRGTVLPADFSYLLLYLYEQINLSLVKDPRPGRDNIVRLWEAYGKENPRLGMLVREWLCDYCLLHRLAPPRFAPSQYRALLGGFRLKEFYIPSDPDAGFLSSAILLFCNNYDYTKSKYYTEQTKEDFDRVLGGAVRVALAYLHEQGNGLLTGKGGISTMSRDCFAGAICSYRLKCRIEVSYTSFSGTHELRFIVTDVLKYAENALRAAFGIRSRLSIYALGAAMRARLDDYLKGALPEKRRRTGGEKPRSEAEMPAYERRYDLPHTPISPAHAAEIEARSWETTKRLVEAFCPDNGVEKENESSENVAEEKGAKKLEIPPNGAKNIENGAENALLDTENAASGAENSAKTAETACVHAENAHAQKKTWDLANIPMDGAQKSVKNPPIGFADAQGSGLADVLGALIPFLRAVAQGDRARQREIARERGEMPDMLVDKINTVAGDIVGDILIEDCGNGYGIVEEYKDMLTEEGVL